MKNEYYILTLLLMSVFIIWPAMSSELILSESYNLYQGQTVVESINVDCSASVILDCPYSGSYTLYALKRDDLYNQWNYGGNNYQYYSLSSEYIKANYDEISRASNGQASLTLDEGRWNIMIQAGTGGGQCQLKVYNTCYSSERPINPPEPMQMPFQQPYQQPMNPQGQQPTISGQYWPGYMNQGINNQMNGVVRSGSNGGSGQITAMST